MSFLFEGVIKSRNVPSVSPSVYIVGVKVELHLDKMRWVRPDEPREWGIHPSAVVVELFCSQEELMMIGMIHPSIGKFISAGRIVAKEG